MEIIFRIIKELEKELKRLYAQLSRSSELVKKLFSVEKYDINKFSLFKEKINMYDFLKKEIYHFSKNHAAIDFHISIGKDIWYADIDQVQFRQVIDNLMNNAIKFVDLNNPKIAFIVTSNKKNILIQVEDNGKGFEWWNIENIFDKYFTEKTSSIWIGIGLYLCKRIVEFHEGKIKAGFSEKLGWAKFIINIPK